MKPIESLEHGIHLIPLIPSHAPDRVSGYIIPGRKTVLIETGTSPCNPAVLSALEALGISPEQIDAIIVTHIHLDHAGGAGLLMQQCPNAILMVHPNGKKHLCNPDKLIEGARQVYGADFDALFNPILPIPETRVKPITSGNRFNLDNGRELLFYETFGHARHHIIAFDTASQGIFTGDMAGVFHDRIQRRTGLTFCFPNTAPTQFDPEEMLASYDLMISLQPKTLFFTHFGQADDAVTVLKTAKKWIPFFSNDCVDYFKKHPDLDQMSAYIQNKTVGCIENEGISIDEIERANLTFDNRLNAQGIIAYARRLQKTKEK